MVIHVTIPWKKHAKQRPRSGRGHTYTPTATKQAEAQIVAAFKDALPNHTPYEGAIRVDVTMSKDMLDIWIVPIAERDNNSLNGDIDNYAKTVLDALNGVAWVDDKQIDHLKLVKR